MAVTLTLENEVDASRGDMLVHPDNQPHVGQAFDSMLVWMAEEPMVPGKQYFLKHATKLTTAVVRELRHRVNVNTLEHEKADRLALNEIARVVVDVEQPVAFDPYRKNRATGAFVIIDRLTNRTVGAGMIQDKAEGGAAGGGLRGALDALEASIRKAPSNPEEMLSHLREIRRILGQ
jgi:bifunctional enzyme CysN/CysC